MSLSYPVTNSSAACQGARRPLRRLQASALALLLAAAPAAAIAQAGPASSPLAQIPGVTVQYYDVAGATIEAINASMAAQAPKSDAGQMIPASSLWTIGASLKKATTGAECKVTGATVTFKAEVKMPRLVNAEATPAPVLEQWQKYVTSLEQEQAARLRYPQSRIGDVERAILASSCDGAGAAGRKAIEEIRQQAAAAAAAAAAEAAAAKAAQAAPAAEE